ncbi:MAG: inorganic phosphate transporter [Verrucomicrobia bacterium]|nr:inorganic phosphate transporter [Verrucomicrobiota bacterium]
MLRWRERLLMTLALTALVLGLAFANGGNDISKGIATLVGSGVTDFRRATLWGTIWTVAGGLVAAIASQELVQAFSGSSLLSAQPDGPGFLLAVTAGAIGWVTFASRTGLPVSTTHAITGALCGAGVASAGLDGVRWGVLGQKFALPLAASPVIALALMWLLFPVVRFCFARLNSYCVCVEQLDLCVQPANGVATMMASAPALVVGTSVSCGRSPNVISRLNLMDSLHWLSAGTTSFTRGLNDTPKILALGIAASALFGISGGAFFVLVAVAMGLGGLLAGFRVTETLAQKVTPMNPTEGFAANLITSLLVGFAARFGMPVSTTHVSSSAIIAIGLRQGGRDLRWQTVRDMLLAWVVTLPVAALLAAMVYWIFR